MAVEKLTDAEGEKTPPKFPWWFKSPTLVVSDRLHVVPKATGINPIEATQVFDNLAQPMLEKIKGEFKETDCQVIVASDNKPAQVNHSLVDGKPSYSVTINPVLLGALPQQVEETIRTYQAQPDELHLISLVRSFKKHLPEEKMPLVMRIGKRLLRNLGMGNKSQDDKNFVNMIFVKDNNGLIETLPDVAKQLLGWSLMCKIGAFKETIIPYRENAKGVETFHDPILVTLDGAHPFMEAHALAQRLMVIGSSKSVGDAEILEKANPITRNEWRRSKTVNGLISLGNFLGEKGRELLSPPIAIHKLTFGRRLVRALKSIAHFSRQAEGAFMAFEPEIQTNAEDAPWTGIPIVTTSGKFGAIKTNLRFKDLIPAIPLRKTKPEDESKVGIIPVAGQKPRGPSVEAEEFTHPLLELALENPEKYLLRLRKTIGGYVKSLTGDKVVPIVRGVVHLHRGITLGEDVQDIFEVDTSEFPAFGCGVDQMQEMSKRVIKTASNRWIERGMKDKMAIFYVPDHGYNIVLFWAEGTNSVIPEDPTTLLKEEVLKGSLRFTRDVPQRHNYCALDEYYARAA